MPLIFSGLVFALAPGVLLVKETGNRGRKEACVKQHNSQVPNLLMFNLNRKYSWVVLEQYFKLGWM